MNFLPGTPIDEQVHAQIKLRQDFFSAKSGENRQYYTSYQQAIPWIKLSSGVRIDLSNAALRKDPFVSTQEKSATTGYSSYLAENNVLFNFLDKNTDNLPGYEYTQLGYRPNPGIISMEIHSHNRFGSLRTAVIRFQCWSKEQLDRLEMLYMRPGYTLLLEYGRSVAIRNKGNVSTGNVEVLTNIDTIPFFEYKAGTKNVANSITSDISNRKRAYGYNYDAIYGQIKNFNWTLRPDGGYDCSTSIVSTGDLVESYKANFYLSQATVEKEIKNSIERFNEGKDPDQKFDGITLTHYSEKDEAKFGDPAVRAGLSPIIAECSNLEAEINGELAKYAALLPENLQSYVDQIKVVGAGTKYGELFKIGTGGQSQRTDLIGTAIPLVKPRPENGLYSFSLPLIVRNQPRGEFAALQDVEETKQLLVKLCAESKGVFNIVVVPGTKTWLVEEIVNGTNFTRQVPKQFKGSGQVVGLANGSASRENYETREYFFVLTYKREDGGQKIPGTDGSTSEVGAAPPRLDPRYLSKLHYILRVKLADPYRDFYLASLTNNTGDFKDLFQFRDVFGDLQTLSEITNVNTVKSFAKDPKKEKIVRDNDFVNRYSELFGGVLALQSGNSEPEGGEDSTLLYIKMGLLLAIINNNLLKESGDNDSDHLFKFVDREIGGKTPKYFTFANHVSVDPSICIFPHTLKQLDYSNNNLDNTILDIQLNMSYILEVLTSSMAKDGRMYLLDFFETIFADIKRVSGGVNELQLQYDESTRAFAVVDRRSIEPNTILPVISVYGVDSIVKNIGLMSKITPNMSSMIAISAQSNPFSSTEESTGFAALNNGLIDSVYTERVDLNAKKGRGVLSVEQKQVIIKELEDDISGILIILRNFYKNRILISEFREAASAHYENYLKYSLGIQNTPAFNFIIPFELNLTLDGIAGLRVMESFAISQEILPTTYGGRSDSTIGFLITGIQHTVDRSGWSTNIKSQIYDTSKLQQDYSNVAFGLLDIATLDVEAVKATTSYPDLDFLDEPPTTRLTYLEAVTYLKDNHRSIAEAVFAVMWAEASKDGRAFNGLANNYAGVQTDAGKWSGGVDKYFYAQHVARDRDGFRVFASFADNNSFLDFMADRLTAKGFNNKKTATDWARTYLNSWVFLNLETKDKTKFDSLMPAKEAIFNTAKKKFDELANL